MSTLNKDKQAREGIHDSAWHQIQLLYGLTYFVIPGKGDPLFRRNKPKLGTMKSERLCLTEETGKYRQYTKERPQSLVTQNTYAHLKCCSNFFKKAIMELSTPLQLFKGELAGFLFKIISTVFYICIYIYLSIFQVYFSFFGVPKTENTRVKLLRCFTHTSQ